MLFPLPGSSFGGWTGPASAPPPLALLSATIAGMSFRTSGRALPPHPSYNPPDQAILYALLCSLHMLTPSVTRPHSHLWPCAGEGGDAEVRLRGHPQHQARGGGGGGGRGVVGVGVGRQEQEVAAVCQAHHLHRLQPGGQQAGLPGGRGKGKGE